MGLKYILIKNLWIDKIEPLKIQIGSIKDYAEVFKIEEILELKFEVKSSFQKAL